MTGRRTLHAITFSYRPVGGVVKTMDYVQHALDLGFRASVHSPEAFDPEGELFRIERLAPLAVDDRVSFRGRGGLAVGPDDLILISLPTDYELALDSLPAGASPERIIHLVQNTRHANPRWMHGYPLRLLTRPAARIATNGIVAEAIRPWLDRRSLLWVNNIGHDLDVFRCERSGGFGDHPVRVAYTTWKSTIGDTVARSLQDDRRFEFRAIRGTATWSELRELYTWADVFLSTPNPEEGTYLPGLEAMAAGSLVVTPDVGGNMDYCFPDENCLLVGYGDAAAYRAALVELAEADPARVDGLRKGGYAVLPRFSLEQERAGFAAFLDELGPRLAAAEGGAAVPGGFTQT